MRHMSDTSTSTRRQFLQQGGTLVAGTAMMSSLARSVHAAGDGTIRLALIGCGPRGSGAVRDALSVVGQGPVKLYATADLSEQKTAKSLKALSKEFADKVDVPADRQFYGFDAYRKAIDLLRPGDIAMCTTRAYIRPTHVEYAVKKGVNVFMEKPFASDPGSLHRLLRAGEEAEKKGLKIAAGLQCRHSPARKALIDQIRSGVMGEIHTIRANRLGGGHWLNNKGPQANDFMSQLEFAKIHLYWVGSGHYVDYLIHQIDECCWIKDGWPVEAVGFGGRVPGSRDCGQNLDVYSIEYTFADGTKAFCGFRRIDKTRNDFATYIHGTKCAAQFSGNVHAATVNRYKDQRLVKENIVWTPEKDAFSPWQYEWNDFITSIRQDRPHNEAKRAVYSDLTTLMGRAACHTGQTVTWDEMMQSRFQFCKDYDALTAASPGPAKADENGQFDVPVPGRWKEV
jgi:predicted dehydrogenase